MIKDHDRRYWIGASDTSMVMGNWTTPTWEKWYRKKLALNKDRFETEAMKVGSVFEHKILEFIKAPTWDLQVTIPEWGLRVNYDGTGDNMIWEVKTHSIPFKVTKAYWQQAQVEMIAWTRAFGILPKLEIVAYLVTEEDYKNFFTAIEEKRIERFPVEYDPKFAEEYLERLKHLNGAIRKGVMP